MAANAYIALTRRGGQSLQMFEDIVWNAQLSRLPGHSEPDDRMRYRVISLARSSAPRLQISYMQGSGTWRRDVVELVAVIESIHDRADRYLSARRERGPVNFHFDGIKAIHDLASGRALGLDELLREQVEPPIED